MKRDTIIIGSGLSGLTCALLLARSGRRVLVLEQHAQPGPVVRGFSRAGLYFDSGFHYVGGLGEGSPFRSLFRHLGLEDRLELFPFAADGFDCLQISANGERFALPAGFSEIKTALCTRFPAAEAGIRTYLDGIAANWSHFPYLELDTEIADFGMPAAHGISLRERLQEFSAYPQLQSLLSMHSLLYGVLPEVAADALNAQVAGSYYHSAHGIVGGGRALVDALLALTAAEGVEIRCCAEVTSLRVAAGAIRGVSLASGEELEAEEVVATLNPTLLPQMLPPGTMRPAYLKRLKNLRQTSSAYILYARTAKPLDFLRRRNLFVQSQAGIFTADPNLPLEERPFYLAAADQGGDATTGLIGIVPARYAEVAAWDTLELRHGAGYHAHKEQLAARLVKLFTSHCPELAEMAEMEILELATPLTLQDYSLAPEGAIYGVGRFLEQYNPHPVTRLSGLYLSGQAIAAPGLLGTVVAGYLTCGSILGHEYLRGEIRACR